MHTVWFSLKRAHLRTLALQWRLLLEFDITPARYLMLYVIRQSPWSLPLGKKRKFYPRLRQSEIRRELGVSAATVCKMLQSLEALGLVVRQRESTCDRRQIFVILTPKAMRLLAGVERRLIRPGYAYVAVYGALGMCAGSVGAYKSYLDRVRRMYDDPATFHYFWCDRTTSRERRRKPPVPLEAVLGPRRMAA